MEMQQRESKAKVYSILWGWNDNGRCGNVVADNVVHSPSLAQSTIDKTYVSMSCGNDHTLLLSNEGSLFALGRNSKNQLGLESTVIPIFKPNPKSANKVSVNKEVSDTSVVEFNCSTSLSSSMHDASLHLSSPNATQLHIKPPPFYSSRPQQVKPTGVALGFYGQRRDVKFVEACCGNSFSVAREISHNEIDYLCSDLYRFEKRLSIFYADNKSLLKTCAPYQLSQSHIKHEKYIMSRYSQSRVYSWGTGLRGELGRGPSVVSAGSPQLIELPTVTETIYRDSVIDTNKENTSSVDENTKVCRKISLYSSGDSFRELNASNYDCSYHDLFYNHIRSRLHISQLSTGAHHVLAVVNYGVSIYSWGNNSSGQLGHGDSLNREHPTPINLIGLLPSDYSTAYVESSLIFRIMHCAAGLHHSAFIFQYPTAPLSSSDTGIRSLIACFGRGTNGQLGNGSFHSCNVPLLISDSLWLDSVNVQSGHFIFNHIACGAYHTTVCGRATDSYDRNSDLSKTVKRQEPPPQQAYLAPSATAVSRDWREANNTNSQSVTVVLCWGRGTEGQLGTSSLSDQCVPVRARLPHGLEIVEVGASVSSTYARTDKGELYVWGTLCFSYIYLHTYFVKTFIFVFAGTGLRGQLGLGLTSDDSTRHSKPSPVSVSIIPRRVETPWACLSVTAGHQHVGAIGVKRKDYASYSTVCETDQHVALSRLHLSQGPASSDYVDPLSQSVIDDYHNKWRANAANRMKLHPELECNSKYEFVSCRRFVDKRQEAIRWRRFRAVLAHKIDLVRQKSLIPIVVPVVESELTYHPVLNKSDCNRCREIEFLCYSCKTFCHKHFEPKDKQIVHKRGLKALLRVNPLSTYFSNNYSVAVTSKTVSSGAGGLDQTELPVYPPAQYLTHIIPSCGFAVRIPRTASITNESDIVPHENILPWGQYSSFLSEKMSNQLSVNSESLNVSAAKPETYLQEEIEPELEIQSQGPRIHHNNPHRRKKFFRTHLKSNSLESKPTNDEIVGASVAASLVTPAPSPSLGRQLWYSLSLCPRRLRPRLKESREEQLFDDESFTSSKSSIDTLIDTKKAKLTENTASDVLITCDCCLRSDCRVLPSIRELTYSNKGRSFIHWAVVKLQRWLRLSLLKKIVHFKKMQQEREIFLFAKKFYNEVIIAPIIRHITSFDEQRRQTNECSKMASEDSDMKKFVKKLKLQLAIVNMNKLMNAVHKCFGQLSIQVHRPYSIPRQRFQSYNAAAPLLETIASSNMSKPKGFKAALSKYLKSNQINMRAVSAGPHVEHVEPPECTDEETESRTLLYPSFTFSWLNARYLQSYLPFNYRCPTKSFSHLARFFPTCYNASSTLDHCNAWYKRDADLYNFLEKFVSDTPYELLNRFYLHLRIKREKIIEHVEWKRRDQFMNRKAHRENILAQAASIMKLSESLTRNNSTDSLDGETNYVYNDSALHTTSILMSDVRKAERLQRQKSIIRHKQIVKQTVREEWTRAELSYQQVFVERNVMLKNATEKRKEIKSPSYSAATLQFVGKSELPCYNDTGRRKRSYTIGDPMQVSHRLQQLMLNFKERQPYSFISRSALAGSAAIIEKSSYTKTNSKYNVKSPPVFKRSTETTAAGVRRRSTREESKHKSASVIVNDPKSLDLIRLPRSRSMPELRMLHFQRHKVSVTLQAMFSDKVQDHRVSKRTDEIDDVVDLMKYNAEVGRKKNNELISSVELYRLRVLLCEELYDRKYLGLWRNVLRLKFRQRIAKGVLLFTSNYFQYWRNTTQLSDSLYIKGRNRKPKRRNSISDPERANRVSEAKKMIYSAQNALLSDANSRFGMRRRSRSFDK